MQSLPEHDNLTTSEIARTINELIRNLSAIDPAINPNIGKVAPGSQLLRAGKLAYANNTDWDPGFGAGLYFYTGSAWKPVGGMKYYETPQQTITSGGALGPFAHGLGTVKIIPIAWLICQTGEYNYSAGDKLLYVDSISDSASDNHGHAITVDATNINIRFGANANVYTALNKTTGAGVALTNANWKLVIATLGWTAS